VLASGGSKELRGRDEGLEHLRARPFRGVVPPLRRILDDGSQSEVRPLECLRQTRSSAPLADQLRAKALEGSIARPISS
jgi:hypothetical protein